MSEERLIEELSRLKEEGDLLRYITVEEKKKEFLKIIRKRLKTLVDGKEWMPFWKRVGAVRIVLKRRKEAQA